MLDLEHLVTDRTLQLETGMPEDLVSTSSRTAASIRNHPGPVEIVSSMVSLNHETAPYISGLGKEMN
jgi:hypothetical protein